MLKQRICYLVMDLSPSGESCVIMEHTQRLGLLGHAVQVFVSEIVDTSWWREKYIVPVHPVEQLGACTRRFTAVVATCDDTHQWTRKAPVVHRARIFSLYDAIDYVDSNLPLGYDWPECLDKLLELFTTPYHK